MRSRILLVLSVVVALALGGCNLQTAGAPIGERSYVAEFDDVQHLVVGHSVRLSDVVVGTVTGIDLDGYDAVVEMSIADGRHIPPGTTASISTTSLLGENYVRLQLPEDADTSESLPDGAELPTSGADASFEELTMQLLMLTRAVQGRDVAAVVEAGTEALGGRGDDLNGLLRTAGEITANLAAQRGRFETLIDRVGELGRAVAPDAQELADTVDRAAAATDQLAHQRDRLVQTVEEITTVAATLENEVLAPHRADIDRLLGDLGPVVGAVNADVATLVDSLEALTVFNVNIPKATGGGVLLFYAIFDTFGVGDRLVQLEDLGHILHVLLNPDLDDPGGTVGEVVDGAGGLVDEIFGVLDGGAP